MKLLVVVFDSGGDTCTTNYLNRLYNNPGAPENQISSCKNIDRTLCEGKNK